MGRTAKVVTSKDGEDRRETGYYSTPPFVSAFLAKRLLELRPLATTVLDPCVGKGELVGPFASAGLAVKGYDIVDRKPAGCDDFEVADFLAVCGEFQSISLFSGYKGRGSDIVVANPPYNCHETPYIKQNKNRLASIYGKSSALNMYSLFLRAIIDYAAPGAVIGLVTHDSFLTAVGHADLRRYILSTCAIRDLHLCPTSLFHDQGADVRTCLLILEKGAKHQPAVRTSNRVANLDVFRTILATERFEHKSLKDLSLSDDRDNAEFVVGGHNEMLGLFNGRRLSEIAPCITGISTGSDSTYLRKSAEAGYSVPFYKNPASRRYFAEPDAFLCDNYEEIAKQVPNFMIRNKTLLRKGGLSCSSMGVRFGATIRPSDTLCGVNPNVIITDDRKWWLLSYLNSRLSLYLVRAVLIRSNMITPGYAARLPVPELSRQAEARLCALGQTAYEIGLNGGNTTAISSTIDELIEADLGMSANAREIVSIFERDPTRLA